MLGDTIEPSFVRSIRKRRSTCYICVRRVFNRELIMKKCEQRIVGGLWFRLLLLLSLSVSASVVSAQPAAKPAVTPNPTQPARVTETQIDSSIADDPGVDKMLAVYSPRVRELEVVLGKLTGELKRGGIGSGSLGNFVADGMRIHASLKLGRPIDLAVMNGGGLRRATIGEGQLRARDIFELLPFENALVTLELNGEQLMRLLNVVVSSREAQSGARITYRVKADKSSELESAKLLNGKRQE